MLFSDLAAELNPRERRSYSGSMVRYGRASPQNRWSRSRDDHLLRFNRAMLDDHLLRFSKRVPDAIMQRYGRTYNNLLKQQARANRADEHLLRFSKRGSDSLDDHFLRFSKKDIDGGDNVDEFGETDNNAFERFTRDPEAVNEIENEDYFKRLARDLGDDHLLRFTRGALGDDHLLRFNRQRLGEDFGKITRYGRRRK